MLRHALGLDNSKVVYRNRYLSSTRNETWEGLVAAGAADREVIPKDESKWWYWATRAGFDAVREPGEKHDGETSFNYNN